MKRESQQRTLAFYTAFEIGRTILFCILYLCLFFLFLLSKIITISALAGNNFIWNLS